MEIDLYNSGLLWGSEEKWMMMMRSFGSSKLLISHYEGMLPGGMRDMGRVRNFGGERERNLFERG